MKTVTVFVFFSYGPGAIFVAGAIPSTFVYPALKQCGVWVSLAAKYSIGTFHFL